MGGALLGEYSTHSFGESPSVAVESHLSQILEAQPLPKYSLSAKACSGILRRAQRRGKTLPPLLQKRSGSTNQVERGHDHLTYCNRVTDYTALAVGFPLGFRPENVRNYNETATTLCNGTRPGNCNGVIVRSIGNGQANSLKPSEKAETLNCMHDQQAIITIDRAAFNQGKNAQYDFKVDDEGVNSTIVSKGPSAVCYGVVSKGNGDAFVSEEKHTSLSTGGWQAGQGYPCVMATQQGGAEIRTDGKVPTLTAAAGMSGNNQPVYANASSTVRRLTPLECERLQGFPDGWTDIGNYTDTNGKKRKTSDSARYKALGNSIALPSWAWLLKRLNRYCRYHTMASLFDGIGGFPLIWETLNGSGSCIWASEIEQFPIAVTKYHFGENI